jgi:hypothetical protein
MGKKEHSYTVVEMYISATTMRNSMEAPQKTNYSGGRDQENHCLNPAQANSSQDSVSEKTQKKKKSWWNGSR